MIAGRVKSEEDASEQLWARSLSPSTFEICCIPFFLYDVALGDEVETNEDYEIVRVTRASGRYVFRVWLKGSPLPAEELEGRLVEFGGLVEWSSANLCAVDAADESLADTIAAFLHELESSDQLTYETGRT